MPSKAEKDRWRKAAARYEKIEKKLRPYVRPTAENQKPPEESWRRSGELQDDRLHGFRSSV